MKCGNCGAENLDAMSYCTVCGTALPAAEANAPTAQQNTGQYTSEPSANVYSAPNVSNTPPAPSTYTPPPSDYGAQMNTGAPPPYATTAPPPAYPDQSMGTPPSYPPQPSPYQTAQASAPAPSMACGNCGKPFGPGESNCTNCGAPITMARPLAPAQPQKKKRTGMIIGIAAGLLAVVAGVLIYVFAVVVPKNKYSAAITLYNSGSYYEALEAFNNLGDYEDSIRYARDCQNYIDYNSALDDMERGNYEDAYNTFLALGDFEDAENKAKECVNYVEYDKAMELYNAGS